MQINISTTRADGSLKTADEIKEEARATIASMKAQFPYRLKVAGKCIGEGCESAPVGLSRERATVLFNEMLGRANANTVFPSDLKYSDFGVYMRDSSTNVLTPVPGLQYIGKSRLENSNRQRHSRPRWVK